MNKLSLCQKTIYLALLCTTTNISTMMVIKKLPQKLYCSSSRSDLLDYFYTQSVNEADLRKSAQENNETELSRLISLGVNVNAKDPYGDTPLHFAACNGCVNTGKILIANKALVNIQNLNGGTPLYDATLSLIEEEDGNEEDLVKFIDLLLNNGAQITIKNNRGNRPDNELAITVGITPPHEIDDQIYKTLMEQCIKKNKNYRFKNFPADTTADIIDRKEINKQKRLNINRAHALLLYERLQHPELSGVKSLAALYCKEETFSPYFFWCCYSNKYIHVSK